MAEYPADPKYLLDQDGALALVQDGESLNITGSFLDMDDVAIPLASIDTVTLTLYDEETGDVINSRDDQDIKNANQGVITAGGDLTLRLGPLDNALQNSTFDELAVESHIARFSWTWSDGVETRTGKEEYRFRVQKLVTAAVPS